MTGPCHMIRLQDAVGSCALSTRTVQDGVCPFAGAIGVSLIELAGGLLFLPVYTF
jgi:hypothetical protein